MRKKYWIYSWKNKYFRIKVKLFIERNDERKTKQTLFNKDGLFCFSLCFMNVFHQGYLRSIGDVVEVR